MTGTTSIDLLMYAFTLVTLLGIVAGLWQVARIAPVRMHARLKREVAERRAAMTAMAEAFERTADGPTRDALARNYRFHRAAVRALDPSVETQDLQAADPGRRAA